MKQAANKIISRQLPLEVLQRVTPELIVEYFATFAFGACGGTDLLFYQGAKVMINLQADTLFYWKKCISHYMLIQNSG